MPGISVQILKKQSLELSVDIDFPFEEPLNLSIGIGTGFQTGNNQSSVNVEICSLSLDEFAQAVAAMQKIVDFYRTHQSVVCQKCGYDIPPAIGAEHIRCPECGQQQD